MFLHRLIKEVELGRYLKKDEDVHHKDGNYRNHNPSNLKVEIHGNHTRKHGLDRGQEWYGFNCPLCKTYFEKTKRNQNSYWNRKREGPFCSRPCASKAGHMIRSGDYFGRTKIVKRFKKFASKKRYHLKNNLV